MNKKELLLREIEHIPSALLGELLDYVQFRIARTQTNNAIESEAALEMDWLGAEEEKAWKNL